MSKKILIVDDDEAIIMSLKVLLEAHGFVVDTASDGLEGLIQAKSGKPDLIVLDLLMPGHDGAFAYREMRKSGDISSIPVLFFSSYSDRPELLNEIDSSVPSDRFFPKPVHPKELLAKINELLAG